MINIKIRDDGIIESGGIPYAKDVEVKMDIGRRLLNLSYVLVSEDKPVSLALKLSDMSISFPSVSATISIRELTKNVYVKLKVSYNILTKKSKTILEEPAGITIDNNAGLTTVLNLLKWIHR